MVKKEYSRAKAELILFREELTTKNDKSTKPGWGWGDDNHEHTGPGGGKN